MTEAAPLNELLSKVIDNRGRTCPTAEDGMPLIATNCVHNTGLYPTFEKIRHVDQATYENWFRGHPEPGDLIFVLKGTPGRVCLTPNPVTFCIAQDMVALRANPDRVDPAYLFAALRSPKTQEAIGNLHVGSMIAHFKKGDFNRLTIPLPDRKTQERIGRFYLDLSRKIELNRQMSATLEEMPRALYRSWFVDFDPVHARALGQPPVHMDATTAALFPDSFGPDGLPKGWEMRSIYDFARVQYGAAFKSSLFNTKSDGRPLVRIRDLKNHSAGVHTTQAHKKEHLIQSGDTVVGMDGDFTAYSWCNEPALMNQRVCSFLPKEADNRSFVRHGIVPLLKSEEEAAVATTVIHLGKKDIDKFLLPDPGAEILEAFSSIVEPLTDRFVRLGLESINLATLRDTLLPRLMSGELRIREAEKQVEEVV